MALRDAAKQAHSADISNLKQVAREVALVRLIGLIDDVFAAGELISETTDLKDVIKISDLDEQRANALQHLKEYHPDVEEVGSVSPNESIVASLQDAASRVYTAEDERR